MPPPPFALLGFGCVPLPAGAGAAAARAAASAAMEEDEGASLYPIVEALFSLSKRAKAKKR